MASSDADSNNIDSNNADNSDTNCLSAKDLNDDELLRYSRQIMLPQWDIAAQLAIKNSRALIIGCGGLGSPAALYLVSAGVGELVLVDDDDVELSNLQRQIIHRQSTLGKNKALSAKDNLSDINSLVSVKSITTRLDEGALGEEVMQSDIVLDCSDNFPTRQQINRLCVQYKIPLVSGAAIRMEGQICVFNNADEQSPCYHCLYKVDGDQQQSCSESGVLSPLVGVIGSYQAMEALKVLSGVGEPLVGRLQLFDGMLGSWRELKLARDPDCGVCSGLI